jgi:hypothetical protein
MVTKVRERLTASIQTAHGFRIERFNFRKLKEEESNKQYCVEISNRFAVFENLDTEVDINRAWKTERI